MCLCALLQVILGAASNNLMLMFVFDSVLVFAGCRFASPGGCSPNS